MLPRIGRMDNQAVPRHNSSSLPLSPMCCTQLLEPTAFSSVSCFFPTLQMSSSPLASPRRSHPQAFLESSSSPVIHAAWPSFHASLLFPGWLADVAHTVHMHVAYNTCTYTEHIHSTLVLLTAAMNNRLLAGSIG
ncbi:hypothetical protein HDV57DRAFT_129605 [Trichoderma longibrachiatum]|uniref:Uncharacterized protein n=1 Tax=Trichoderma longibrachiatum ATCC 18648 TaxID=983965 RepID=A0A2T4BS65_TRILO|nr:hypothetical protein M440DRAFT_1100420 [Trichoderma longibrachiatum ATCC 18648]